MFVRPTDPSGEQTWTDDHQFLYSLLWSSFLDLDAYSASRFRRRFFPYSTEFVVRDLLWNDVPAVRYLKIGDKPSRLANKKEPVLSPPFQQLALWTVVPRLFDSPPTGSRRAPRALKGPGDRVEWRAIRRPEDDFVRAGPELQRIVAEQLRDRLDIDVASFRFDADARPLVPPGLGLGIEDASVSVAAGRRRAIATLTAAVQVQFDKDGPVAEVVDPSKWELFDYWGARGNLPGKIADAGSITMQLGLPGGNSAGETKWRPLSMDYAKTSGPFGARVDYDCVEIEQPAPVGDLLTSAMHFESERAQTSQDDHEDPAHYAEVYLDPAVHIARLRGYLRVEKIEGRPGWTRFIAQREARFLSPNHDRFRAETLIFWLTCELLSFAEKYAGSESTET